MPQIILSESECENIYEALITGINEQQRENAVDKRRGRPINYGESRLDELRILKLRIEPYVK